MSHHHQQPSPWPTVQGGVSLVASICALVMGFCALTIQPTNQRCLDEAKTAIAVAHDANDTAEDAANAVRAIKKGLREAKAHASEVDKIVAFEKALAKGRFDELCGDTELLTERFGKLADEFHQASTYVHTEADSIQDSVATIKHKVAKLEARDQHEQSVLKNHQANLIYLLQRKPKPCCVLLP